MQKGIDVPEKFGIPLTEKCHLRCGFCMNNSDIFKRGKHMSLGDFKEIVNWLTDQGVKKVDLTPIVGEPLLVPHLGKILDFLEDNPRITEYDLFTSLGVTDISSLLGKKKINLFISLYGFNREQFIETTGKNCFDIFLGNMKKIILNKFPKKVIVLQRCPDISDVNQKLRIYLKMSTVFYFNHGYMPNRDNKMADKVGEALPCNFMYEPVVNQKGLSLCCKDIDDELKIGRLGESLSVIYGDVFEIIKSRELSCNKSCGWFEPLSLKGKI